MTTTPTSGAADLRAVLQAVRDTLQRENDKPNGPITDTIWHGPCETLFDFIDAALASAAAPAEQPGAYAALERLEHANDALCKLRTDEQYMSMIDSGQQEALAELDAARNAARAILRASHGQAPAQAAPAAVAGPSGYGPKVTVKRRCSDCKACNSESYAVQGDSGHYVYCEHPSLPERKYIGDTHWDTPDWCPAAAPTAQPAPQHQARPVTPYTCPKCSALWLHWPAEQSGFGRDTLNCRSTTHCDYCEKGGVEQLQRLERVPAVLAAPQQEAQEQARAIREGNEIAASDKYFSARPQIVSADRRKVFQAGFERGWDAARAAQEGKSHDN